MFIVRMAIPFSRHLRNSLLAHLHLDIASYLLGYSNKGRRHSVGIELMACFYSVKR